jgi:excisionase family DNA binding protein
MTLTADSPNGLSGSAAYLSARQAADYCGVSEKTIRNWIAAGRLSADKSADGFHIRVADLQPFCRRAPRTPQGADGSADRVRAESADSPHATVNPEVLTVADVLQLVREARAEAMTKAEAAAMWQARAELLSAELERLRQPALPAGVSHETPATELPRPWWAFWRR